MKILKNKWLWIGVGTAAAIGGGYWLYNKYYNKPNVVAVSSVDHSKVTDSKTQSQQNTN